MAWDIHSQYNRITEASTAYWQKCGGLGARSARPALSADATKRTTYTWKQRSFDQTEKDSDNKQTLVTFHTGDGSRDARPEDSTAWEVKSWPDVRKNHVGWKLTEHITWPRFCQLRSQSIVSCACRLPGTQNRYSIAELVSGEVQVFVESTQTCHTNGVTLAHHFVMYTTCGQLTQVRLYPSS